MIDHEELTCQELVELVTAYLDNAQAPADRRRFDAHLVDCDGCSRYLEQMRTSIRVAGMVTEEQIDPAARDNLLRLFRDWKRAAL